MSEQKHRIFSEFRKAKDPASRVREFVLSTGTKDRHGTIIPPESWILDRFCGTGFYQHDSGNSNPDYALGPATVYREGDAIIMAIDFEPADLNPLADKVLRKIDNRTLKNASAGFIPHEGRRGDKKRGEDDTAIYLTKNELLEGSVVNIPSNYQAQARKADDELSEFIKSIDAPTASKDATIARRDLAKTKRYAKG